MVRKRPSKCSLCNGTLEPKRHQRPTCPLNPDRKSDNPQLSSGNESSGEAGEVAEGSLDEGDVHPSENSTVASSQDETNPRQRKRSGQLASDDIAVAPPNRRPSVEEEVPSAVLNAFTSEYAYNLPNERVAVSNSGIVMTVVNRQNLEAFGILNGMRLSNALGAPGDCMFASIRDCMAQYGTNIPVSRMRQMAALYLRENAGRFEPGYRPDGASAASTFEEFCRRIGDQRRNEYGTHEVLVALADAMRVRIRVVNANDGSVWVMRDLIGDQGPIIHLGLNFSRSGEGHYFALLARDVNDLDPQYVQVVEDRGVPASVRSPGGKRRREDGATSPHGTDGDEAPTVPDAKIFRSSSHRFGCDCEDCLRGLAAPGDLVEPFPDPDEDDDESLHSVSSSAFEIGADLPDGTDHCANCLRTDTTDIDLELRVIGQGRSRRKWGHLKYRQGMFLVCQTCHEYLQPGRVSWAKAWPSVLSSLLFDSGRIRVSAEEGKLLWACIPDSLREAWHWARNSMQVSVRDNFENASSFRDVTKDLAAFWAIRNPAFKLDTYYKIDVKCPLGCDTFMEATKRLSLKHYVQCIIPSFSAFDADSSRLGGRRGDWPRVFQDICFGYEKSPSLVRDGLNGISVLYCEEHADLSKAMVHAPHHAIYNIGVIQAPERLSTVTLCPKFLRGGRTGETTTTSPMFKLSGGSSGLSSFKIGPTKWKFTVGKDCIGDAEKITLLGRPDIQYHARRSPMIGDEFVDGTLNFDDGPSDVAKVEALSGASYVPVGVAFHEHKRRIERDSERLVLDERARLEDLREFIPVHPYGDRHGMVPLISKLTWSRRGGEGPSLLWFATLLVHLTSIRVRVGGAMTLLSAEKLIKLSNQHSRKVRSIPRREIEGLHAVVDSFAVLEGENELSFRDRLLSLSGFFENAHFEVFSGGALFETNYDTVVLLRDNSDIVRGRNLPPDGEKGLRFVYCPPSRYGDRGSHVLYQRWSQKHDFWKWTDGKGVKRCGRDLPREVHRTWTMAVYDRDAFDMDNARSVFWEHIGGQSSMTCAEHNMKLVKEGRGCPIICSVIGCRRKLAWRCPAGMVLVRCRAGVCGVHGKAFVREGVQRLVSARGNVGDDSETVDSDSEDLSSDDGDVIDEGLVFLLDETGADDERGIEGVFMPHFGEELHSGYGVDQHQLLNPQLNILRRNVATRVGGRSAGMMQYLQCDSMSTSIPVLYPEGLIFPNLFHQSIDDSVVGALPSFMYFMDQHLSERKGKSYASLEEHFRTRLTDGDGPLSHSLAYINFAFNTVLNQCLVHKPSYFVQQRGLEAVCKGQAKMPHEASVAFGEVSAKRNMKNLSAMQRKDPWRFFVTLTCNDSGTPGVAQLRQCMLDHWKTGSKEKDLMTKSEADQDNELLQAAVVPLIRAWQRFCKHLIDYLLHHEDKILGDINYLWMRWEFQDAAGNKPHIHMGVSLKPGIDGTVEDIEKSLDRICLRPNRLLSNLYDTDTEGLLEKGIIGPDDDKTMHLLDDLASKYNHNCDNASGKCMKRRDKEGNYRCRVARHPRSYENSYEVDENLYTVENVNVLTAVGLAEDGVPHSDLLGGRYHYACEGIGVPIPTVPLLFAICRSMTNVQVCTKRFSNTYLTTYMGGKEEHQKAKLREMSDDGGLVIEEQGFVHAKIAGARFLEQLRERNDKDKAFVMTQVSLAECAWFAMGNGYVEANVDFINVPTLPPEQRSAMLQRGNNASRKITGIDGVALNALTARRQLNLPDWRQFTANQERHLNQYVASKYTMDKVTLFSVRPPELMFVNSLEDYFTWFECVAKDRYLVDAELGKSPWMDGTYHRVYIRSTALKHFVRFARDVSLRDENVLQLCREVVDILVDEEHPLNLSARKCFVFWAQRDAVVVFNMVSPVNAMKFLVHLCLSMGRFETEFDLFSNTGGSIRRVLQRCGLLPNVMPDTADERQVLARGLVRRYVLEQMQYHSSVKRMLLIHFIELARKIFESIVENDEVYYEAMPVVDEEEMAVDAENKVQVAQNEMGATLLAKLVTFAPDYDADAAHNWRPQLDRAEHQTDESFAEQTEVLDNLISLVDHRVDPVNAFTRSAVILGVPGAGKTFLLMKGLAYAKSRGLKCALTCLTSERARELGGVHVHRLLPIPVNRGNVTWPYVIATSVISKLLQKPIDLAVLQRLDILAIEEIGIISSELISVLDEVFRTIRKCSLPFGGLILFCTGDPGQLTASSGRSVFTNPHFLTSFKVLYMKHLVRSAGDEDLGFVIKSLRDSCANENGQMTDEVAEMILGILDRRISGQTVERMDQLPDDMLFVVGKRIAETEMENDYVARKKHACLQGGIPWIEMEAIDLVQNSGQWLAASEVIRKRLDMAVLMRRKLFLFVNSIVRLTENSRHDSAVHYSQGQLAIVETLPTEGNRFALTIRLLPPGARHADVVIGDLPFVTLQRAKSHEVVVRSGNQLAQREQFPVRLNTCSTCHKVLGATLNHVAFRISSIDKKFSLWDRKQVTVILSRVRSLDHVHPVGNWAEIRNSIKRLLLLSYPFDKHIYDYISDLNDLDREGHRPVVTRLIPGLIDIPPAVLGYVYILVSENERSLTKTYVGETDSLRRRLNEHRYGIDGRGVGPDFRPILFGFVVGFPGAPNGARNVRSRKDFETELNAARARYVNNFLQAPRVDEIITMSETISAQWNVPELRVVQCCQLAHTRE